MVAAEGEPGSVLAAAVTSPAAAVRMSRSYRSVVALGSWPPARKPLEAVVLASASER